MRLLDAIAGHAAQSPSQVALETGTQSISYAGLRARIDAVASWLRAEQVQVIGLDLDNGPAWAVLDLAALSAGVSVVPLPPFFSPDQLQHCLREAGVQAVITDQPEQLHARTGADAPLHTRAVPAELGHAFWVPIAGPPARLARGIVKVTYTSGTTGEPKGVMLDADALDAVSESLAERVRARPEDRHLTLMPLAVLLENIAGLYVPLISGATCVVPPLSQVGMTGAARLDAARLHAALLEADATTALFTPQTLDGLMQVIEATGQHPTLRFAAVGGAVCAAALHERAARLGLAVYEGYGVSEAASVITLNTPEARRRGSVGQPLPHVLLRTTADGEIEVRGALFRGYLGGPDAPSGDWLATGDLGRVDADGYLYLHGRRRNVFITAYGRNVSPDWVEGELCAEAAILQAAVFGEARPFNTAVIVPSPSSTASSIEAAIERVNQRLPDYARVGRCLYASEPFTPGNGQLSGNGRNRREFIERAYSQAIARQYTQETYA